MTLVLFVNLQQPHGRSSEFTHGWGWSYSDFQQSNSNNKFQASLFHHPRVHALLGSRELRVILLIMTPGL